MMRRLTPWLWLIGGAAAGGLIGWSGVLCGDGSCSITGTWAGGAVFGGLLGLGFAGRGCPSCAFLPREARPEREATDRDAT